MMAAMKRQTGQNKKYSKQKEQPHSLEDKQDENNIPFDDEGIETDDPCESLPPFVTEKHISSSSGMRASSNGETFISPFTKYASNAKDSNGRACAVGSEISSTLHSYSDLHTMCLDCFKHPKHNNFIPIFALNKSHLPKSFRKPCWVKFIELKAINVVRLTVSFTSENRPEVMGFKGVKTARHGTGTVFLYNMDKTEPCSCNAVNSVHSVSGLFRVLTAAHVVFDDEEARNLTIDFFYDSADLSTVVKGWGVRVCLVDVERNRSIIECRTHDLSLFQRLCNAQKQRNELLEKELQSEVSTAQMVVLISHPHGMCKQVSFGNLTNKKFVGDVKKTKEGVALVDCLLTYDTPTCAGSGGGPVNVIGGGAASYAFAPHYASNSSNENLSGLGWAKVNTE